MVKLNTIQLLFQVANFPIWIMQFLELSFQFGFTGRVGMDKRTIKTSNAPKDGFFIARKDTRLVSKETHGWNPFYHYLAIHVYINLRKSFEFKFFGSVFLW